VVGFKLIELAGKLVQHVVGILLLCWRRVFRAALIAAAIGIVLTELVASLLTQNFPPGIPAHVAAIVFGAALAYGVGLTVLVDELLKGAMETVRLLEGDARAGARAAAIAAERDVGEFRRGLLGLLGSRSGRQAAAATAVTVGVAGAAGAFGAAVPTRRGVHESSAETEDDIAATDEFSNTAPRPRINARPVRADQLPRISWAYEQRAGEGATPAAEPPVPVTALPDLDPLPPLPLKPQAEPAAEPSTPVGSDVPAATTRPLISTSPLAESPVISPTPSGEPALVAEVAPPQPVDEPRMVPIASQPVAPEQRGVWSRISQALVGNTLAEPAEESNSAAPDAPPADAAPAAIDASATPASAGDAFE
jgi:hypothetical protein